MFAVPPIEIMTYNNNLTKNLSVQKFQLLFSVKCICMLKLWNFKVFFSARCEWEGGEREGGVEAQTIMLPNK